MKTLKMYSTINLLSFLSFLICSFSIQAQVHTGAQLPAGINGINVQYVEVAGGDSYASIGNNQWGIFSIGGDQLSTLTETGRDEWSVYLSEQSTNMNHAVDLWQKKLKLNNNPVKDIVNAGLEGLTNVTPQAPTVKINGINVQSVDVNGGGSIASKGNGKWGEFNANGNQINTFTEQGRDEWSVYLTDHSQSLSIRVDLWKKEVINNDSTYYTIEGVSLEGKTAVSPTTPQPTLDDVKFEHIVVNTEISGLNLGFVGFGDGGSRNIAQIEDKKWVSDRNEYREMSRTENKLVLEEILEHYDGNNSPQIVEVDLIKKESFHYEKGYSKGNGIKIVKLGKRKVIGIDKSPKIHLNESNFKYRVRNRDPNVSGQRDCEWVEMEMTREGLYFMKASVCFGNPRNSRWFPVQNANNTYKKGLKYLIIKVEKAFEIDGINYVGIANVPTTPKTQIADKFRYRKEIDLGVTKCELDLKADWVLFKEAGQNTLYVTLGNSTTINASVGGMNHDEDDERGYFLYDVKASIEPAGIGNDAGIHLDEYGPQTSPLSGSDATTDEIGLELPTDGSLPTVSITESNTITVNSQDFRAKNLTSKNKLSTMYHLSFSADGGEILDKKDLVVLRAPGDAEGPIGGLTSYYAGVAELPERAKGNFPIMSHGKWKVNKDFNGMVEVNVVVEANLLRMHRVSKYGGLSIEVKTIKQPVKFETSFTIPAMYLK